MSIRKNLRILIFFICSIFGFMIYYKSYNAKEALKLTQIFQLPEMLTKTLNENSFHPGYAIFSPRCKMMDPDPWHESVRKYIKEPHPLVCSRRPLLTYVEQLTNSSNVLKINKKVLKKYKVSSSQSLKCCYSVITRINQNVEDYNKSADSLYELSNCTEFSGPVLLSNETEFILVDCQSQKKYRLMESVYKDVHPVIPILPEVKLKMAKHDQEKTEDSGFPKEAKKNYNSERLNVVILGIDSVSKLNIRRVMPKTLNYLQQNEWVELNGYNKIGENTFPNLMAILSGEPMNKLNEMCWANRSQKMDDCPFIWKDYSKKGYITLYAEDTPSIATFNLLRTGFVEKPTDYYMRPFMQSSHDLLNLKNINGLPVCLGPVLIVDHVLNYAKRFLRTFNNYSYFSLLWLNSLSHNDLNAPRALDNSVHKFLSELSAIGTYNNSLFLLLSDHGVRFGDIRETFLGYLEERLPFMFIWFPTWFREKHPDKYNNLLVNQNRLTSPYDVYVTLQKLLTAESQEDSFDRAISSACPKCKGLLEVQAKDRSCEDASININWCLCSEFRSLPVKGPTALEIGKFLYEFIFNQTNKLIKKFKVKSSLCSKWKFLRVFRIDEIISPNTLQQRSLRKSSDTETIRQESKELSSNTKAYVIIIELNPGRTKFEATVQTKANSSSELPDFIFLEAPKRLDGIYRTSKCVESVSLKHYCYCVKQQ